MLADLWVPGMNLLRQSNINVMFERSLLVTCLFVVVCATANSQVVWERQLTNVATLGSPRVIDLNEDGIKDVVLTDGIETDSIGHVSAFDGLNGNLLWSVERVGELYSSPQFMRINEDQIDDVLIGGRLSNLFCVDGLTGQLIWEFDTTQLSPNNQGWLQFYEPQSVRDVNADNLRDIVVINGGDPTAPPNPNFTRKPGYLLLLDASNGMVLSQAMMPDSAESYCSIVVDEQQDPLNPFIYFGSGGEVNPGALWRTTLTDLLDNDISNSTSLVAGSSKGFIAPPTLADFDSDGILDIVGAGMDGTVNLVNGATLGVEWSFQDATLETYSVPAVGDFNGDGQLDVLCNMVKGVWPSYQFAVQVMFDGSDGTILRMDTIGVQISSPIAYDIDNDGKDEGMLGFSVGYGFVGSGQISIDYALGVDTVIFNPGTSNIASTPCLADMFNNGELSLIEVHYLDMTNVELKVWNTNYQLGEPLRWTSYHGTEGDGIYHVEIPTVSDEFLNGSCSDNCSGVVTQGQFVAESVMESIELYDISGKRLANTVFSDRLDFPESLNPGIYVITCNNEKYSYSRKLIVQ